MPTKYSVIHKRGKIMIITEEIILNKEVLAEEAEAMEEAIKDLMVEVHSSALILTWEMPMIYLESSLVEKIHLLDFLKMMTISLEEVLE